jgi:hypothetical protein
MQLLKNYARRSIFCDKMMPKMQAKSAEVIAAKRANPIYVSNRSDAWVKIINWMFVNESA